MTDTLEVSGGYQVDPFIRVKAEKVSQLLDLMGELGLATALVTNHPALSGLELEGFQNDAHRLENLVRDIQDRASSMRMVPAEQLFHRMQRLARDLLHQTGKAFDLVFFGEGIEVDKLLLDQMSDPLIHLLRNAVDHGLEDPEERKRTGKPERGLIQLGAEQRGREILISVRDDGRGLDREAILNRARAKGLLGENEAIDDEAIWKLIFLPGFSTATTVSTLSGRGVGMDVVQSAVRALRGRVQIETEAGKGSCVTLVIPLTLAFLDCMVVKRSNRLYAIPIDVISEVFSRSDHDILRSSADGSEMARWHAEIIPIRRFDVLFHEPAAAHQASVQPDEVIIVVDTSMGRFGLPVEAIIGQQQVMLKPMKGALRKVRGSAGCALLSSGEVAVALDMERLLGKGSGE
jgi:two-component system, chemotaxis family, sensor kinase CheA